MLNPVRDFLMDTVRMHVGATYESLCLMLTLVVFLGSTHTVSRHLAGGQLVEGGHPDGDSGGESTLEQQISLVRAVNSPENLGPTEKVRSPTVAANLDLGQLVQTHPEDCALQSVHQGISHGCRGVMVGDKW